MFNKKWSKWIPITIYIYESVDFILLGKINKKTGYVKFKSIKVHGRLFYTQTCNMFQNPFDANKNLLDLFKQ